MNWEHIIIFVIGLLLGMVIMPLAVWWLLGLSEREEVEKYKSAFIKAEEELKGEADEDTTIHTSN